MNKRAHLNKSIEPNKIKTLNFRLRKTDEIIAGQPSVRETTEIN